MREDDPDILNVLRGSWVKLILFGETLTSYYMYIIKHVVHPVYLSQPLLQAVRSGQWKGKYRVL